MLYSFIFSKQDKELFLMFWKKFEKNIDNFKNITIKNTNEEIVLVFAIAQKANKDILNQLKLWLADNFVVHYKMRYLENNLKLPSNLAVPFKAVCKALAVFDKLTDVEYVINNINITNELNIKSLYVFKFAELRLRWQEICSVFYLNLPELVASDAFFDLLKYLLSVTDPIINGLYITELDDKILLKDDKGIELVKPIQKNNDYKMVLILEVISLAPQNIYIKPEFGLKEVAESLKQLFNDKVVYCT